MNELHWTGAAVLLSLAVLGNTGLRLSHAKDLDYVDFAGEDDLNAEAHDTANGRLRLAAVRVRGAQPDGGLRRRAS